jgi:hypothetical protein
MHDDVVLKIARLEERETRFSILNSGDEKKRIMIEHARPPRASDQGIAGNWRLADGLKPAEETAGVDRFAVDAEPGKEATLAVRWQRTVVSEQLVGKLDPALANSLLKRDDISKKIKALLTAFRTLKDEERSLAAKVGGLQLALTGIYTEQTRLRKNMDSLDKNAELYRRYAEKLNLQEDQLEEIQQQMHEVSEQLAAKRKVLEKYSDASLVRPKPSKSDDPFGDGGGDDPFGDGGDDPFGGF